MTFLTKTSEKSKDSYKILYLPNSDVVQGHQSRRKTDKFFLIIFAAFIALLLPLLIYTLCYWNINRLIDYSRFERMYLDIWKVVLLSFVPLALCLMLVLLFRKAAVLTVWSILVGLWLIFTLLGLLCLQLSEFLWNNVIITIYCFISLLILCSYIFVNMDYIKLAAPLLKEATRPLFEVKMLSFVPAGALTLLIVILLTYAIVNVLIRTSIELTEVYTRELDYVIHNLMLTTIILNALIAIWTLMLVLGAQYTTVSGVVAQWYTIKNLDNLDDAVSSNIRTTINYHLGTAILGSVMIIIMFVPRLILQFFTIFSALKQKADSWLRCLDGFFTNNSYIITAIHGTSFIKSGKKSAYLLKYSIGDTRELNSFANSVIRKAQIIVIFISTLVAYTKLQCDDIIESFFIEFAIGCACAYTILETLKISTNTLFFCATEELLRNEEADLPYNMAMQKFVKGSNKLFLQKVQSVP